MPLRRAEPPGSAAPLADSALMGLSRLKTGASQVVLVMKTPPATAGGTREMGLIPESGRSPGGRKGNPLQYSCLEKSHGQRNLEGYSAWGCKRFGHDLATKQQQEES